MTTMVHIVSDEAAYGFRAKAGNRRSFGRTAGEALDALLQQEGGSMESSTILIQRFGPDAYFSQAQHDRMKDLMNRRKTLSDVEDEELNTLIDAELEATIARAEALLPKPTL